MSADTPPPGADPVFQAFLEREQARGSAPPAPGEGDPPAEPPAEPKPDEPPLPLETPAEDPPAEEPGSEEGDPPQQAAEGAEPAVYELADEDQFELDGQVLTGHEIRRGFLREKDYTHKTQALAEERRTFEATRDQRMGQLDALLEHVQGLVQGAQPSAQEMAQLKQDDPGLWAARMQELQQRQMQMQVLHQERARIAQEEIERQRPQEWQALLATPDLDPAFKKNPVAEYGRLGEYVVSPEGGGLSPEMWQGTTDHRLVRLARKAQLYDEMVRSGTRRAATSLARKPRTIRPGTMAEPAQPGDAEKAEYAAALEKAKEGGLDDLAAAFAAKRRLTEAGRRR